MSTAENQLRQTITGAMGSPSLPLQPWSNNDGSNEIKGVCEACGQAATLKCSRCNDFYCSPQCQKSDWLKHRATCFKMPALVQAKSI